MGILNVTPDSFSDGGLYFENTKKALYRVGEMVKEGADIIDVGGESTRPGATPVSAEEELKRVLPIIEAVRKKFGKELLISIDTHKAKVAEECLRAGANMVNSLGGFTFDDGLADIVAKYHCRVILYHIKGEPRNMQGTSLRPATQSSGIVYKDVIFEIKGFFNKQIDFGLARGINRENFILDPGIGFGKALEHNLEIIKRFEEFKEFNLPLLVGVSRKSHLGVILKEELSLKEIPRPEERIEAGLAEVAIAVLKGASIVRTHDVLQTKKFLAVLDKVISFVPPFHDE